LEIDTFVAVKNPVAIAPGSDFMIETERLFFRKLTTDDLPWLINMRSPEPVNRFLGGTKMQNPESLAKRLQFYIGCYDRFGFGNCAMGLKETGELIGTSGLQPLEDSGEIEVECAYGWLKHGFENCGLTRIVAVSYPDNVGSWKIMEKCGMTHKKTEPHYGVDCVFYAIEREKFLDNTVL
jgi:RimJ/RimL family protein N-acetyltransferase